MYFILVITKSLALSMFKNYVLPTFINIILLDDYNFIPNKICLKIQFMKNTKNNKKIILFIIYINKINFIYEKERFY